MMNILSKIKAKVDQLFYFFPGTINYWEKRYSSGGTSGGCSVGNIAKFKSDFLNNFVIANKIDSVIEFGCGDGRQLELMNYPKYLGIDICKSSIDICMSKFNTDTSKSFILYNPDFWFNNDFIKADLSLSLDVIYCLIEIELFQKHILDLFASANKFVVIFSSNSSNEIKGSQVKHRNFTNFIQQNIKDFEFVGKVDNPYTFDPSRPNDTSYSDFYVYKKIIYEKSCCNRS